MKLAFLNRPAPNGPKPPRGRMAWGLLLIGTGRVDGFAQFGASGEAFLASLAPLVAILLVLSGMVAWAGQPLRGLTFFLFATCDLLAPPIIADLFCRVWHRRERWGLHANVLNCSQWLIFAVILLLLPAAMIAVGEGMPPQNAAELMLLALVGYIMWFHWFAARHALMLSRGRALLVMGAIVFGTGLLLELPVYAGVWTGLIPPSALDSPFGIDSPDGPQSTPASPAPAEKGSTL